MSISIESQSKEEDIRERGNINLKGIDLIKFGFSFVAIVGFLIYFNFVSNMS